MHDVLSVLQELLQRLEQCTASQHTSSRHRCSTKSLGTFFLNVKISFYSFSKINISILEIFKRKIKLKDQSRHGSGRRYCNIYQMMCDYRSIKNSNYKLTSKKEETTSLCPNTVLFSLHMSVTSLSWFELDRLKCGICDPQLVILF